MKQVVVHPERCVGCMQCMTACATAHSKTKQLFTAVLETPLPKPRVHVGVGLYDEGFPNRCRHCDPAPCLLACLPGAIFRDSQRHRPHRSGQMHQLRLLRHGLPLRGDPLPSGPLRPAGKNRGRQVRQLHRASGTGADSGLRGNLQVGRPDLRGTGRGHETQDRRGLRSVSVGAVAEALPPGFALLNSIKGSTRPAQARRPKLVSPHFD